jgi:glucose/arabinose dehydrogenase
MRVVYCVGLWVALVGAAVGAEIRTEAFEPKPIRIEIGDLPKPNATPSASKNPQVVPVPKEPVLRAPAGFKVSLFAEVPQARWLALTPDGRVLCVSSRTDTIYLLPDADGDGAADTREVFADKAKNGLNLPFGMAFADGAFFVGNTDRVIRFPYKDGQKRIEGKPRLVTLLPGQGYNQHWTRNVIPAPGGGLYVSVGSESNAGVEAPPRAAVTWVSFDGTKRRLVASGLRNPVGLAVSPKTKQLYATVNERDELGDDLVPDYFTAVEEGAFYGWPYAYLKPDLLDPRHVKDGKSVNPELAAKTKTPDVPFEAHSAALGLTFYTPAGGAKGLFPERYRSGAFVAFRGSWNRSKGTGYKIVYVPFGADGRPEGTYEDFVTGFLIDPAGPKTWGRPVGVLSLPDGSLLFTEEENGRVYRVRYEG